MFYKLINLIKINYSFKKKFFLLNLKKNELHFCKILIKYNYIKYIKITNNKKIIIFLNYTNNKNIFYIKNLYKPSLPKFIKIKELNKLNASKKYVYILSTNQGLITNIEALNKNIGGILLAKLMLNV